MMKKRLVKLIALALAAGISLLPVILRENYKNEDLNKENFSSKELDIINEFNKRI